MKAIFLWNDGRTAHLVVHRSATRRRAPTRSYVNAVFDDAGHSRVAAGKGEHFLTPRQIVLGVVFGKRDALGVVIIAGLLTVRAARFDVHDNAHCLSIDASSKVHSLARYGATAKVYLRNYAKNCGLFQYLGMLGSTSFDQAVIPPLRLTNFPL